MWDTRAPSVVRFVILGTNRGAFCFTWVPNLLLFCRTRYVPNLLLFVVLGTKPFPFRRTRYQNPVLFVVLGTKPGSFCRIRYPNLVIFVVLGTKTCFFLSYSVPKPGYFRRTRHQHLVIFMLGTKPASFCVPGYPSSKYPTYLLRIVNTYMLGLFSKSALGLGRGLVMLDRNLKNN